MLSSASAHNYVIDLSVRTLGDQISTACLLEAAARKPGNVHPGAAFEDLTFEDFKAAAVIAGKTLDQASRIGVGSSILDAVRENKRQIPSNANLGILLLIAPLAAVPSGLTLHDGISSVLNDIDLAQTELIYEAIRLANPGGLGSSESADVSQSPQMTILEAMHLAAERDMIARQYSERFQGIVGIWKNSFLNWFSRTEDWELSIIGLQLEIMAAFPDSLIQRKCGQSVAEESSRRAAAVLAAGWPLLPESGIGFRELDDWLRSDQHRLNPGTTADLIAAVLFAAIRDQCWKPPSQITVRASPI